MRGFFYSGFKKHLFKGARIRELDIHRSDTTSDARYRQSGMRNGNFSVGEDTHTLRLESELSDLRVGYANPATSSPGEIPRTSHKKRKNLIRVGIRFFLVSHSEAKSNSSKTSSALYCVCDKRTYN